MRAETLTKKELVEVGGRPIIWHVMRIFSAHGFNQFVLTLGYQAEAIKRYFLEYELMCRDVTLELAHPANGDGRSRHQLHGAMDHPTWEVSLVNTGLHTEKGRRIVQVSDYLEGDRFFVAYGDDVSDVDLGALLTFHRAHGKMATITAVQLNLQYGVVEADEDGRVSGFRERPRLPYWINGGFMLFEKSVLPVMAAGGNVNLETEVLPELARQGQLMVYRHSGFWKSMNTFKDTLELEQLWQKGAPWKIW